jgi:hypothetical protein
MSTASGDGGEVGLRSSPIDHAFDSSGCDFGCGFGCALLLVALAGLVWSIVYGHLVITVTVR